MHDALSVGRSEATTELPEDGGLLLAAGVARSAFWAVSGQIAILAATFVATPFTIRLLRPAAYGVWALLSSLRQYFSLADLGMAVASTKFAADCYAQSDDRGETAVIWTALAVTVGLTTLVVLLVGAVAPLLIRDVLHTPPRLRSSATLTLRFLCGAAVCLAVAQTINTPQQVRLRWRSLTLATSGPAFVQVAAAPIVLAVLSRDLVALGALVLLASAGSAALNGRFALRLQPMLRIPTVSRRLAGPLVSYGGALAVAGFASIPLLTAERFFLAHFRSPTVVAYYAVAATLGSLLIIIPSAVAQPLLPALSRLASQGRTEEHRQLYHQALRAAFLLVVPASFAVAFVSRPFLTFWAGPAYGSHSVTPLYVILVGVCGATLAWIPRSQLLASGRAGTFAWIQVAELVPYLPLSALLAWKVGAVGAAIAWSLRSVADAAVFFVVTHRLDRLPLTPTPRRAMRFFIALALLAAAFVGVAALTESLVFRSVSAVLALAAFAYGSWTLVVTQEERSALTTLVRANRRAVAGPR